MKRFYKALIHAVFIFTKVIHLRRLTGSLIHLRPLSFKNSLNFFTPLKQDPVRILYSQIL